MLSRIDLFLWHGEKKGQEAGSYLAFNPKMIPGSLAVVTTVPPKESLGNKVAAKLALEGFVTGALEQVEQPGEYQGTVTQLLEASLKKANTAVYHFGHQLAAGGRMAAHLLSLIIDEGAVAAGRAGGGRAYLYRAGKLFPFFEGDAPQAGSRVTSLSDAVGEKSLMSVEVASVALEAFDVILLFSDDLVLEHELTLPLLLEELPLEGENPCKLLCHQLFHKDEVRGFCALACVGPEVNFLSGTLVINDEE